MSFVCKLIDYVQKFHDLNRNLHETPKQTLAQSGRVTQNSEDLGI